MTGAGAPVAAVAFGAAALASGVSAALEIASDPEKRAQLRQAANWIGEKTKAAGSWVKTQVQRGVRWAGEKVKAAGSWVQEKVRQVGQAAGGFFRKAGALLGGLLGGG